MGSFVPSESAIVQVLVAELVHDRPTFDVLLSWRSFLRRPRLGHKFQEFAERDPDLLLAALEALVPRHADLRHDAAAWEALATIRLRSGRTREAMLAFVRVAENRRMATRDEWVASVREMAHTLGDPAITREFHGLLGLET